MSGYAEPPRDDFELHARQWSAEDRLLALAWGWQEEYALAPAMVEELEEAFREGGDAWKAPLADLWERKSELEAEFSDES